MKPNIYIIFFIFFALFIPESFSQPLPEQDCIAAIPVCQDVFIQNTPYSGIGSPSAGQGSNGNEINGQYSCLSTGEANDVWYTFTVQTNGNLCFNITPSDTLDDYDWAVFNLTSSGCDDIFNDSTLEVECNFSGVPGITGANGSGGLQNEPCITVFSGETYVLNISNFYPYQSGYTLDFSSSTAQLYDNTPPALESVIAPISCGDTQIFVSFSENIICSSVQTSDFVLSGPSGNISISNIYSTGCTNGSTYDNQFILIVSTGIFPNGNFTLKLLTASVEDLCNNANINDFIENFLVTPYSSSVITTPELCGANNGTATAITTGGISPYYYSWNTINSQNTQTATGLIPGVYTVTVTDNVGCISTGSGSVAFDPGINPPIATISASTNATCSELDNGSATVSVSGGVSPYSYEWNTTPPQSTANASGLGIGTYIVTVTGVNGCYDTVSVVIGGGIPIIVNAMPDTSICIGGTATLYSSVSGGVNPFTFTWLKNGIFDGNNIPYPVNPSSTTVFSVFATDDYGCRSDTDEVIVNVFPPIDVNISPVNIVCPGDSVKLKANVTGGKGSGYSYVWTNTIATGSEVYVKPNANTTYSVTVSDGCTFTPGIASVNVTAGQPPPTMKIFADPLDGCVPLIVQFHIEPFMQGYIYMWDFGDGNLINTNKDTVENTFLKEGCKDIKLTFITNESCMDSIIDSCMINPFPSPEAAFSFLPSIPTTLNPIVNFTDRSSGAESWQWELGDNSISNNQMVQHEYADSGNYLVKLVVLNDYQCSDTIEQNITVNFETTIYISNTFSPNDDQLNDYFKPMFEGFMPDGYLFYIFDRWGRIVYQTDNINDSWNGKNNGKYAEDGVYVYYIKYKTIKGEEKRIRGSVTLLK